ncbi:MAG: aromatic amino acid transporter AroP, partial [Gammaproteobacteria bacterium]|nr:aromatic amino acid transporter AroP [Gammaproteobacteria bacterium]
FRRSMQQQGVVPSFKALWSPFGNWLCLAFVGFILVVLSLDSGTRMSVFALPVWVAVIGLCYLIRRRVS